MPVAKTLTKPVQLPALIEKDGRAVADSRDVAAFFGKQHKNVIQSIETLTHQEPSLALAEFSAGVYTIPSTGNQKHRRYEINRDGFTLLAMGFTGPEASREEATLVFQLLRPSTISGVSFDTSRCSTAPG